VVWEKEGVVVLDAGIVKNPFSLWPHAYGKKKFLNHICIVLAEKFDMLKRGNLLFQEKIEAG